MAKKPSLGYGLSRAATIAGWCYLPFYLFLLSYLIQYVAALLGLHPSMLTVNLIYFAVNLAVVLIIFHDFLRQRFFGPGFWNFVQAIILGFVLYYAATWAVRFALDKLAPGYTIYNNETVGELVLADRRAMSFVTIILAPIIEETLVRGLVFGSLHRTSRWLAYIVSCFLFVFMHNWQYFALYPAGSVRLSCVPYIPAAVALGWVYEKSSTIWAPITLHALINAMSVGVLTLS